MKKKIKYYIKKGNGRVEAGIINDIDRLKMKISDTMRTCTKFDIKITSVNSKEPLRGKKFEN